MPFALPELDAKGQGSAAALESSKGLARARSADRNRSWKDRFPAGKSWLNADSPKRRLVARYVYEHLFLAHLYFGDDHSYFRLVRSRTPPGQAWT